MSLDNNNVFIGTDAVQRLVLSNLWSSAADFTHTSWVDIDDDFKALSLLTRKLIVSKLLEIPAPKNTAFSKQLDLQQYERFVRAPTRYLLLAGICANPNSKNIGLTKDPELKSDELFAKNLGQAFSMTERFNYFQQDDLNAVQIGLRLFYRNLGEKNKCIWHVCKLALEKNLIQNMDHNGINDAGVHASALSTLWSQIDNYLVQEKALET